MSRTNKLRDALLNVEPMSPERQQRFRDELDQIVNPPLPSSHRLYYAFALLCLAIGLPGTVCGLIFDAEHRLTWSINLLACSAGAGWFLYVLCRGAEPSGVMQGMSKVFVGLSAVIAFLFVFFGIQNPSLANVLWALLGILVFLLTSSINLWNRMLEAERLTRQNILRVEYRLADLASHFASLDKASSK